MPPGTQQSKKPMSSAMQTDKGAQVVIPRAQNVEILDMSIVTGCPSTIRITQLADGRWVTPVNDAIMCATGQDNDHAGQTWRGVSKEDKMKIREDLVQHSVSKGQNPKLDYGQTSTSPPATSTSLVAMESKGIANSTSLPATTTLLVAASGSLVARETENVAATLTNGQKTVSLVAASGLLVARETENGLSLPIHKISYALIPDQCETLKAMIKFQANDGKYYGLEIITLHLGLMELPHVLKHPKADAFRRLAKVKLADYFAGNERIIKEVFLNAASNNPFNVRIRESIEASDTLMSSMAAGTSSATGGIPEDPVDYNGEEELDESQPTNVMAKHSLKTGDPIGEGFMDIDRLTVVTQMDDKGLKNVKDMMECGLNTKRELVQLAVNEKKDMMLIEVNQKKDMVLIEVNREKDLTLIKDESLDKQHKRQMETIRLEKPDEFIKVAREMSNIKEDELDREHKRQMEIYKHEMEMLKLKAAISQGGGILNFDPSEEDADAPASITNKRDREESQAVSAPRHLPAATENGLKFFYQFMSAVALNTNMEGCMVMKFYEFYAKWAREKQALPVDRFSRHAFSSQVRAVKGTSSQRTTKGIRYWFDHKALKKHLQDKGVFDERAEPLEIE